MEGMEISYRTKQPEQETVAATGERIGRNMKSPNDRPVVTRMSRAKSDHERRAAAQKMADVRTARANAQRAAGIPVW